MNKTNNKLILILAILAFVFGLFWSLPAYAYNFTVESGVTLEPYNENNYNYGNNYNYNYNYGNISNPRPVIFLLNPSSINRNSGPLVVAISGNYFMPGAIAKLNGSDRTTTYISSTYLQMQLSYTDTAGSGNYLVTVYNPTPGGGLSNTATLNIIDAGIQVNNPLPASSAPAVAKKTSASNTVNTVAKKTTPNGLEANVLSSGFLPSNIIQWLVLLILALLAIVLWRKIYLSKKDKETPLKHD